MPRRPWYAALCQIWRESAGGRRISLSARLPGPFTRRSVNPDFIGIVRRSSDVSHARDPNEFLEVFGNELRPVIGDDPRSRSRVKLLGTLEDDLDVRLGHRIPQIPVHDVATAGDVLRH